MARNPFRPGPKPSPPPAPPLLRIEDFPGGYLGPGAIVPLERRPTTPARARCAYCRRWGAPFSQCEGCGAPLEAPEIPAAPVFPPNRTIRGSSAPPRPPASDDPGRAIKW